ncbi:MAG: DUF1232 domain-containing protein [Paludibacteraceae bacterium]|nr:DUF1232 domain-containing protein [Paludibacteraceae bacterium]
METKQPKDVKVYQKYYSESGFWKKLGKVAIVAGSRLIYCALLLYYVLKSPDVLIKDKAMIIGALGYFILPVDLIPDFIPVAGYADDMAALVACYNAVKDNVTPEIEQQAQEKLADWFGDIAIPEL